MATMVPFGEVYVHTCIVNGKSYVGQTTAGVAKRWKLHVRCARSPKTPAYGNLFSKAIRKYGAEAFEHQTLSLAGTQPELDNLEKIWIILLQTKAPHGYNLTDGGDSGTSGHTVSPETRAVLSAKQKANWSNPTYRAQHVGYTWKQSPEQVEKRAAARRGVRQAAETVAKRIAKTTGMKRSGVALQNIQAGAARRRGTTLSAQTKSKMSASHLLRYAKEKNSNGS